jgi:hypothetical protein
MTFFHAQTKHAQVAGVGDDPGSNVVWFHPLGLFVRRCTMQKKSRSRMATVVASLDILREELELYPGATNQGEPNEVAELLRTVAERAAYVILGNIADITGVMAVETDDEDWRQDAESYAKKYRHADTTAVPSDEKDEEDEEEDEEADETPLTLTLKRTPGDMASIIERIRATPAPGTSPSKPLEELDSRCRAIASEFRDKLNPGLDEDATLDVMRQIDQDLQKGIQGIEIMDAIKTAAKGIPYSQLSASVFLQHKAIDLRKMHGFKSMRRGKPKKD